MSTSNSASTTSDDGMDDMIHGDMSETGAEFDRLYLQLMIVHHQGAIEIVRCAPAE